MVGVDRGHVCVWWVCRGCVCVVGVSEAVCVVHVQRSQ